MQARYHCPKCKREYNLLYPTLRPNIEGLCDVCNIDLVQRPDDSKVEFIQNRLRTYHDETEPMFKLFEGKVASVDGDQPIEKVAEDIIGTLN